MRPVRSQLQRKGSTGNKVTGDHMPLALHPEHIGTSAGKWWKYPDSSPWDRLNHNLWECALGLGMSKTPWDANMHQLRQLHSHGSHHGYTLDLSGSSLNRPVPGHPATQWDLCRWVSGSAALQHSESQLVKILGILWVHYYTFGSMKLAIVRVFIAQKLSYTPNKSFHSPRQEC